MIANDKIVNIFPENDFKWVCNNASDEIIAGIVIGYDADNNLTAYGGGMLDGKQPVSKDWLWIIEEFKHNLLAGNYSQ